MKKLHEFNIKLRFNRPCTKAEARYHAKNHIFGKEYLETYMHREKAPDTMYIGAIGHKRNFKPLKEQLTEIILQATEQLENVHNYVLNTRRKRMQNEPVQIMDIDDINDLRFLRRDLIETLKRLDQLD